MDYESFKEKFVEDVKDRLYEQGAEVDLSIHTVNKLNESYEAITVTPEGSNIGVNIGIDKFYGAVEDGRPYDEVVDKAVDVMADYIYVINVGGYIGESTKSEIDYAELHDKTVKYLEPI